MKKIILFAICLIAIAGSVKAQGFYRPRRYGPRRQQQARVIDKDYYRLKFGFVGGVNLANVFDPYDPTFSTNIKTGYHAGVSLDIPISYPFMLETELMYSVKGYSANTINGQFTQTSNFIDWPLLLKMRLAKNFNMVVGPQISFLTSTQNTFSPTFPIGLQQQYNQDSAGYSTTLLDGVFGLSFDLNRNLELRGRYTVDLQTTSAYNAYYNPQYTNQVFQIGIAYKF